MKIRIQCQSYRRVSRCQQKESNDMTQNIIKTLKLNDKGKKTIQERNSINQEENLTHNEMYGCPLIQ